MNIYRISQTQNTDYDTFDSAVVAAETEEDAKNIDPSNMDWDHDSYSAWCSSPKFVTVKLLGFAVEGTKPGVLLASFNAG